MNKFFHLILLLSVILGFTACSKDSEADNIISDPQGLDIELTWTNDASDPALGADLELYISENFSTLLQSAGVAAKESISITPGILNDGTYDVDVFVYDISKVTNYRLTFKGKSSGKVYVQDFGPINANDRFSTLKPRTLVVSGNRYTVSF